MRDEASVQVPATSANRGPGFAASGLAAGLHAQLHVRATTGATSVHVTGAGAGEVPDGEDHLVVRAIRVALDHVGAPQAGLELRCQNTIPHGRGLGTLAAAVVGGLVGGLGLVLVMEDADD